MRLGKLPLVLAALVAVVACGQGAPAAPGQPVTLQFSSYAWQTATLATNHKIVDDWNKAHPNIQVTYIQVDPNTVHDKLVTQFQGNTAPDIVHDEAADLGGFVRQGYLANMSSMIPADLKGGISKGIWDSVTFTNGIYGVPTLLQSYVIFANKSMLDQAGIAVPTTDKPWTWDQLQQNANKLTTAGHAGLGWGLKSPTATVMSMGLNFGGVYFYNESGKTVVKFNQGEQQIPKRIHDMAYVDKSLDPVSLGQSGTGTLPGFFGGKYAMLGGGNYLAQQMTEQAPAGFQWVMLPLLKGDTQAQNANPQTLSITAQSKNKQQAMDFINYFMSAPNLAADAQGDWLAPTTASAGKQLLAATSGKSGWDVTVASAKSLQLAPFQKLDNYPQWKTQIATPALQQYLKNQIDLTTLGQKLTAGWQQVNG